MRIKRWEQLPEELQTDAVRPYWEALRTRNGSLLLKRIFDVVLSFVLLAVLSPLFLVLAIAIKLDSPGPVFYRQVRVTQYGKKFCIHKFRSMTVGADKGSLITVKGDARTTRVGRIIRAAKLDELPQLIDVLLGDMSFVGTRPEVEKYVERYEPAYRATLLLPAGITSMASLLFKDENELLDGADDIDAVYLGKVLPVKMYYNLKELPQEGLLHDCKIMAMTLFAILGKEYEGDYRP